MASVRQQGTEVSGSVVMQIQPATVVMTGIEFMQYGDHYLAAARRLAPPSRGVWFDPLPYQLLCQSLELHLKAFIWLVDRSTRNTIKNKYGHDIEKLWRHSKARGLSQHCRPTPLRDATVALLGPYYKRRQFAYLDLSMSFVGIPALRQHPKACAVVARLCRQLSASLHRPILNAS